MICSRDTIFAAKLTPDLSPSISSHGAQLSNPAWQYVHQIEDIHTHIHTHARYGTVLAAQAFPTKDGHQLTPYRRSRRTVLWHCLGTSTMVRCAMCDVQCAMNDTMWKRGILLLTDWARRARRYPMTITFKSTPPILRLISSSPSRSQVYPRKKVSNMPSTDGNHSPYGTAVEHWESVGLPCMYLTEIRDSRF